MAERDFVVHDSIIGFSRLTSRDGVNVISLEGTIDTTIHLESAVAIFPLSPNRKLIGVLQTHSPNTEAILRVYSKVAKLILPQEDQMEPNEQERLFYETRSAAYRLPSMMILFGKVDGKDDEAVLLYVNAGESPGNALAQLQAAARDEIAKYN